MLLGSFKLIPSLAGLRAGRMPGMRGVWRSGGRGRPVALRGQSREGPLSKYCQREVVEFREIWAALRCSTAENLVRMERE